MSLNAAGSFPVPLSVFGSLCTEMASCDVPEGISPDNQDVVFAPGNVASRPCCQRLMGASGVFGSGMVVTGGSSVVWAKTFVNGLGDIENLWLDSTGVLWWQDFTNNPATSTALYTVTAGSKAKSVTAFGREYIAFNDGLHGTDRPLQWDGTNLYHVTQDGPGNPPVVASIPLPSVAMVATGAPATVTLTECDPAGEGAGGSFSQINCFTNSNINNTIFVGGVVSISGNTSSPMNVTNASVIAVYPNYPGLSLFVLSAYLPAGTVYGTGGTATIGSGITMSRANNVVTVTTASAHQLLPGYQAQITSIPAESIGGGIASVVINNESLPGLATITTNSAHGLVPNIFVSIAGIVATTVGGTISAIVRTGDVVTVTTSTAHGLSPSAVVTIAGVTDTSFDTTVPVSSVISATKFTFLQTDSDASSSGGTVTLNWPIPYSSTPNYYQVQECPSATTFLIAVSYSDGTWGSGGTVSYAWNGIFPILSVPNTTSFTYQQYGPNATTSVVGTVTPYGQAAPGLHQCQVAFLTANGLLTRPSPPVSFYANGGQYVSVANIPIGPANVVARVLLFTGAGGSQFFYIPVPAQINGQPVSTATQVNDNTTTGVLLDFSDNTLFAAIGVSIPGNDIANQIVLDGLLGIGFFNSRLITWGQSNRVQNLLNMTFDGGYLPASTTLPSGWLPHVGNQAGALIADPRGIGFAYQVNGSGGAIQQSFYQDGYGAPIAQPVTQYSFRAWVKGSGTLVAKLLSASTSFSASATLTATSGGYYSQVNFTLATPAKIPSDMLLTIQGSNGVIVTAMSIIYAQNPYVNNLLFGSYIDNPEAFDGVSGAFGPALDPHKVMDFGVIRATMYLFTQDPSGRIHAVIDNGVTEPSGWAVNEVAANCGVLSAFCLTKSQADDSSGSGGEEWLAWASSSGARIFDGSQPWKISQEIQPDWDSITSAPINSTLLTIWALNDPSQRVLYFGLPTMGSITPNLIYPMNYRHLDTAYQIANSPPFHPSFSGHLIATDNTRKWTRWNLAMSYGALMQTGNPSGVAGAGSLSTVFCSVAANANAYRMNSTYLTDDDFGHISPYYTTYFFVNSVQEPMLRDSKGVPFGSERKIVTYLRIFISGTGYINVTIYPDALTNPWTPGGLSASVQRTLSTTPSHETEFNGANAIGDRFAVKVASSPISGTDNGFSLQKLTMYLKSARHLPVRGSV